MLAAAMGADGVPMPMVASTPEHVPWLSIPGLDAVWPGFSVPNAVWIAAAVAILLLALVVYSRRSRRPAESGMPNPHGHAALQLHGVDFEAFETLVQDLSDLWHSHDSRSLAHIATPKMAQTLTRQMQALEQHGGSGTIVHEVMVQRGELIAAWSEHGVEHAQMNLRISSLEARGHDAPQRRYISREIWNFERSGGHKWRIAGVRLVD
jgi:predicted lipid-binding transport protein (Tim44 family)